MKKILLFIMLLATLVSCGKLPERGVVHTKTAYSERVIPYNIFGIKWVDYREAEFVIELRDENGKPHHIFVNRDDFYSISLGDTIIVGDVAL